MTSKEKTIFRRTSAWKNWRKYLLQKRNYTCEICGIVKKKGLQVHHLDEEHYTALKEDKFVVLCSSCHKEVERLVKRKVLDINLYKENIKKVFEQTKSSLIKYKQVQHLI